MTVFISGGCKNGKSTYALHAAKAICGGGSLFYAATMIPHDDEDLRRIERHVREREGWGFSTIEKGFDICEIAALTGYRATILLDSVTALLSNEMFREGDFFPDAGAKVISDLKALCGGVRNIVLVSDYIYSNAETFDEMTGCYMRSLAAADREAAKLSDTVIELCSGNLILHKGKLPA
jgi:adenosylcobinamide kinase/adenosylcobinamide-phosphate guanylyltransferase